MNGQRGTAPIVIDARVGSAVPLDATGTREPDGDGVRYTWFFHPEAGTGIPDRPGLARPASGASPRTAGAGGIPSVPQVDPRTSGPSDDAECDGADRDK